KLFARTSVGWVRLVRRASVSEYSSAPTYGTSTSTASGISAGASSSHGAAQPNGARRSAGLRAELRPGATRSAPASLLSEELVDFSRRLVQRVLGGGAALHGLLDRGEQLL